jgi:8-oxo-dGTP pyrophosphatase MutT (NUDIX family)
MKKKRIGPWTQLSVRSVYQNPWIHVEHHEVIRPDGNQGVYGVVHFASRAVGVVPIDEEGFTWLVGQHRYPLDIYSWEIPEGGTHLDEEFLIGAKRELLEETGICAQSWVDLGGLHTSNSVCNETGRVFLARALTLGESSPDGDEQLSIRRIRFADALALAIDGSITDCISMVGLFRAKEYLRANDPEYFAKIMA